MRYAFVQTLIEETRERKKIFLLTGDLGFTVFEEFRQQFPDNFINVGVAEQNLMGVAAGLAFEGNIVFVYSIATFATLRAFEFIRNDIASHSLPVVVVGTGSGLSYGHLQLTHHSLEDISLMRSIPGMNVICPADSYEAEWATRRLIKLKKPAYLRLGKKGEKRLHKKDVKLRLGKGQVLRKGKEVAILATGNLVDNSLQAAEILAKGNIQAAVVSMHSIKPLDKGLIRRYIRKYSRIVTVEEHSIIGGLGSAVSEVIAEVQGKAKLLRIGIFDSFVEEIGTQAYLRRRLGLSAERIANKIRATLRKA